MRKIPCPLCGEPLRKADRPSRIMNGRTQGAYDCTCHGGVEAWVMRSWAGKLFVVSFTSKDSIRVRIVEGTQIVDLAAAILKRYALDRHNIDEWADEAERVEHPGSKNEAAWLVRELWRERYHVGRLREELGNAAIFTDDGHWAYPKDVTTVGPEYVCDKCGATLNYHYCPACDLFLDKKETQP